MKRADPIVEEIHKFREKLARHHGFDVKRIAAALREKESAHPDRLVSRPPRRVPRKKAS
jgi:hypothetical protein